MALSNNLDRLPEEARNLIALYIVKIEEAEFKKRDLIRELAEIIQERQWIPAEYISSFLRKILKDIVTDKDIQRALGRTHKDSHKKREAHAQQTAMLSADDVKKEIEVSTDGNIYAKNYIDPVPEPEPHRPEFDLEPGPIPTKEEILETGAEIVVHTINHLEEKVKDLEIRLDEALTLADKKSDEIEKLHLSLGEFELQLRDKMKEVQELKTKEDKVTDQVIAELQSENNKLKNALREYIKRDEFSTANKVDSPPTVWVSAVNCFGFSRSLMQISMKLTDSSARLKVLFDIAADGSIKNPRLETTEIQEN